LHSLVPDFIVCCCLGSVTLQSHLREEVLPGPLRILVVHL
jgi:hypothetical protein